LRLVIIVTGIELLGSVVEFVATAPSPKFTREVVGGRGPLQGPPPQA
jgi:hypothetical protein